MHFWDIIQVTDNGIYIQNIMVDTSIVVSTDVDMCNVVGYRQEDRQSPVMMQQQRGVEEDAAKDVEDGQPFVADDDEMEKLLKSEGSKNSIQKLLKIAELFDKTKLEELLKRGESDEIGRMVCKDTQTIESQKRQTSDIVNRGTETHIKEQLNDIFDVESGHTSFHMMDLMRKYKTVPKKPSDDGKAEKICKASREVVFDAISPESFGFVPHLRTSSCFIPRHCVPPHFLKRLSKMKGKKQILDATASSVVFPQVPHRHVDSSHGKLFGPRCLYYTTFSRHRPWSIHRRISAPEFSAPRRSEFDEPENYLYVTLLPSLDEISDAAKLRKKLSFKKKDRSAHTPYQVNKLIPEFVQKEVLVDVVRQIPVGIERNVTVEFTLPKFRSTWTTINFPVYAPRFIEVPIPSEVLDASTLEHLQALHEQVQMVTAHPAPSICEVEILADIIRNFEMPDRICDDSVQSAITALFNLRSSDFTPLPINNAPTSVE